MDHTVEKNGCKTVAKLLHLSILVISCFGLEGWIWVLISSVPDRPHPHDYVHVSNMSQLHGCGYR